MTGHADAIVVGLGAAGGIIAEQLAKAGLRVVALEKGARFSQRDFYLKHDEIRYFSRSAIVPSMATDPITWRPGPDQEARVLPWAAGRLGLGDPFQIPPSIGTGGGTLHWGGAAWRFREADFRMHSTIRERFGEAALPDGHTLVDWPLSYAQLEPYYDRVEWQLGVSGQAGNLRGELQEGGNPYEAPRQRDFPMPPLQRGSADASFVRACRNLGYHPFPEPAAIASVPFQGRPACTYCGYCHGFPCHVGSKQSSQVTSIPAALATGNLEIRPHSRVYHVNADREGVRGVSYFDGDGVSHELSADLVVLACYALENTRLLLASGLNRNGEVGSHFMLHNYGWFNGVLPEWSNPFAGPLAAASVIDDLTSELIPDNDEGVLWGSPITSFPGDTQPIEAIHNLPPTVPRWGSEFKAWIRENFRRLYKMYSQTSTFPMQQYFCDLDPNVRDAFGQPALRITHDWAEHDRRSVEFFLKVKRAIGGEMGMLQTWQDPVEPAYHVSVHDVGTHRMGEDPSTSVVDLFGEVHECPRLYAVGGGQFPSLPAYNPTHTIQALAYLTSDHIVRR